MGKTMQVEMALLGLDMVEQKHTCKPPLSVHEIYMFGPWFSCSSKVLPPNQQNGFGIVEFHFSSTFDWLKNKNG